MKSIIRIHLLGLLLGLGVLGCKHTNSGVSGVAGASSGTEARSAEIHDAISSKLEANHGNLLNKVWVKADGFFSNDWLVQSPENYWGKSAEELPINLGCKATDKGCDKVFERMTCSTDADCASRNTTCQPLASSVAIPGQRPQTMCLGSGDALLDRFYKTITSADTNLDITTLGMAAGRFRPMLINALSYLAHKKNPPQVRILMSGAVSRAFNAWQPAQGLLDEILKDVYAKDDSNKGRLSINLGYLADGYLSWNHAKIILADQSRMITGGHNFYDPDYLSDNPIFDLSLEISGPIAANTQNYINELWSFVGHTVGFKGYVSSLLKTEATYWGKGGADKSKDARITKPLISRAVVEPKTSDTIAQVIGLGRLGTFEDETTKGYAGNNPSDTGLKALIASSRNTLDMAVQDLYFRVFFPTGSDYSDALLKDYVLPTPKAPWLLDELTAAVLRGVKLRVVQSDQKEGVEGYTMTNYKLAYKLFKESLVAAAKKDSRFTKMTTSDLNSYICEHVEYAPWRFTQGEKAWKDLSNAGGLIGSHPKLIVVDNAAFYIGSHNFYGADLQEYGVIVTNAKMTSKVNAEYWDKVWSASEGEKVQDCK
ncbi:MAG: hypothetical protein EOP07_14990 [Proteobacteria bacterium]|nr:MAG: hypothetical protein EOP07_14990 [Pseudomonadota bacterium]